MVSPTLRAGIRRSIATGKPYRLTPKEAAELRTALARKDAENDRLPPLW